MIPPNVM